MDDALLLRARAARDLRGRALVDAIRAVPARDRDTWVDELLGLPPAPPDEPLPRGAVPNLSCAVDDVLAMLDAVALAPTDTLVDLGAGLGRVAMLAHLVTGARAHGIELQASLVELARAAALALPTVTFTHADASAVPLAGSVFFLYAPCNGDLLRRLLARLAAAPRPFVVATIDLPLDDVPWLRARPSTHAALAVYDAE